MSRRVRLVATLGPATSSPEAIGALVAAGLDVARLNFSHGTHAEHAALCAAVRRAAEAAGRAVGVLADLQGPKIRLGAFAGGGAVLAAGAPFTLTTEPRLGGPDGCSTTYAGLAADVRPGDLLLVDDGRLRLRVEASDGVRVRCVVLEGGPVSDHKGLNLPGVRIAAPTLTAKDEDDLRFALAQGVDLVALSFVRAPEDVRAVHAVMDAAGGRVPVIAKLEKPEAVAQLEAVVRAFDGVMVARGDLGVEIPLEQVPLVQKRAVRLARAHARPVIVATQMLESMVTSSRPTRAEASDVANAVLDGADALMLSGETSVGAHPVAALETMARIALAAEAGGDPAADPAEAAGGAGAQPTGDAIAAAAVRLAAGVGAAALVAFTRSGATARRLAAHRPATPLLAFTSEPVVRGRLTPCWGVETFVVPAAAHSDERVRRVDEALLALGRAARGDRVVIVSGAPPGPAGGTNTLRVHRVGDA